MERVVYDRMAELDQVHWWYTARRRVLADFIQREVRPPADAQILEIGCGTGHNVPMLRAFGTVDAVELDDDARAVACNRLGMAVVGASLPTLAGLPRNRYDLVALLDVIEHVENDVAGLSAVARLLSPGGQVLITVPAHQWMFGAHDRLNHHFRRYSRNTLRDLIEQSGLRVDKLTYFNSLLFPLAVAERLAGRITGKEETDDSLPPAALNRAMAAVFGAERYLIGRVPMPPGLSLIALASAT